MRQVMFYRSRGGGLICGYRWLPDGEPKAVVQIVHGIVEHAARYAPFAEFLNSQGFLVVAEDHMGHGESITEESPQGYWNGGWFAGVDDTYQLCLDTRAKYPELPYVLFGHSMGSFIVRNILARYPDSGIDAAVVCGTGWMNSLSIRGGQLAAKAMCLKDGERNPSPLLYKLMIGAYNARIKNPGSDYDWLSTCRDQVDTYNADPLCGFTPAAGLVRDLLEGVSYIQQPETLAQMKKDLPVLFIAGGEDPVGGYGRGVERTAAEFAKAGMLRVESRIYPGVRHEILNDRSREEVYNDVGEWIKSVLMD